MRVPGHALVAEGAPHVWNGRRYERVRGPEHNPGTTSGAGKALCSCGKTSPRVDTSTLRKKWHREHREEIVRQQDETGWPPERVKRAISFTDPSVEVSTRLDGQGKTLVIMPFDDLCSFVEWLCGSISEFELDGFVRRELERHEGSGEFYHEVMRRRTTDETQ